MVHYFRVFPMRCLEWNEVEHMEPNTGHRTGRVRLERWNHYLTSGMVAYRVHNHTCTGLLVDGC